MCPPDGCFASGCVGQRVADKQPVACGVDTTWSSVAIGTTYTLNFVVYNTAGLQASVQRVVNVISPCTASEFFCNGTCSKVGPKRILNPLLYCLGRICKQQNTSHLPLRLTVPHWHLPLLFPVSALPLPELHR